MSQTKLKTREDYEAAKTGEYLNLKSDLDLRAEVAALEFEDKGDENMVGIILKQKGLSPLQRGWCKNLIERKGAKYSK